jgi:hypothetical protein
MRDLKTLPCGVITYGVQKTKNLLTSEAKENAKNGGDSYDKDDDAYRHMYEHVPFTFDVDQAMLERLDEVEAGTGPDATGDEDYSADGPSHCFVLECRGEAEPILCF